MLKKLKQATLSGLKRFGVFTLVQNSGWRRSRLLILAYHGVSLEDEHLWNPALFMQPDYFRARIELLNKLRYAVLPLDEAIRLLYTNDLPENCAVLTFDDGYYDFYRVAYPILKEFNFPATIYLTTFYVHCNRPIFDAVCSYMLWKGKPTTLDLRSLTDQDRKLDTSHAAARGAARDYLIRFVRRRKLPAEEKDAIAARLARQLRIDYDELCAKRMLSLLNPEEVRQLADEGVDIQLHTHHHQSPRNRQEFDLEVEENRINIHQMTGRRARHFCYPGGIFNDDLLAWLAEMRTVSATTCDPGLASSASNPLSLPRLVDTMSLSPIEFEGWLTGVAATFPRRRRTHNRRVKKYEMRPDISVHG
ncbi:MAG: polysaccharide deacetylase family protein [Blastocatellia bacterium]